jgi:hypothetical protein
VQGSSWTNPLPHTAAIDLPSGQLAISGGSLLTNLTFNVMVSNNNALVKLPGGSTNSLTGSINPKTGLLTITFRQWRRQSHDGGNRSGASECDQRRRVLFGKNQRRVNYSATIDLLKKREGIRSYFPQKA